MVRVPAVTPMSGRRVRCAMMLSFPRRGPVPVAGRRLRTVHPLSPSPSELCGGMCQRSVTTVCDSGVSGGAALVSAGWCGSAQAGDRAVAGGRAEVVPAQLLGEDGPGALVHGLLGGAAHGAALRVVEQQIARVVAQLVEHPRGVEPAGAAGG